MRFTSLSPVAQHLIHALVSFLAVLAIRPFVRRDLLLVVGFAFLLFNPMTFDTGIMTRVSRSHLYAASILLALVSVIALATLRRVAPSFRLAWLAVGGIAAGWAWITREETILIVPPIVVAAGGLAWWLERTGSWRDARAYLTDVVLAGTLAATFVATIAAVNLMNYGAFVVTEIRGGAFARAYGALTRIPPVDDAEFVAVSDEARRKAYQASPAFRELEPFLEGRRGDFWLEQSRYFVQLPRSGRGFHRGWFMWALRDAVDAAGYYTSAADAAAFYERMATELNAACERDASLQCAPPRATPRPSLTPERLARVVRAWIEAIRVVVTFDRFSARPVQSISDEDGVQRFREWTRWPVSPHDSVPAAGNASAVLEGIGLAYATSTPFLALAAVVAWVAAGIGSLLRRRIEPTLVIASGALALFGTSTLVVAMVEGLAFPAINMLYLAPAYPALLVFIVTAILGYPGNHHVAPLERHRNE